MLSFFSSSETSSICPSTFQGMFVFLVFKVTFPPPKYLFFLYFDDSSFILYILCSSYSTSFFSSFICFAILNISFCCSLLFSSSLSLSHASLFALATSVLPVLLSLYIFFSLFWGLCHLLYAIFFSYTTICTASSHHHVSFAFFYVL